MLRLVSIDPRLGISSRLSAFSQVVKSQARSYAQRRTSRGQSLVRQTRPPAERDVWVDPFKMPPPPQPDFRVLIRPAIFTAIVLLSADYIADHFVARRTSEVTTRAERSAETTWTILPLIGVNVAVFGLWRVFPSLLHRIGALVIPYAPTPAQLVVGTFSHQELWHLLFNQVGLYSFGSLVCDTVGREHFLALYLQAACVSNLASVSATQFLTARGIYDISHLTRPSLGASGVVYAMLGISTIIYPEMRIGVIFVPFLFFPIKYAFPALCAVDTAGLFARWSQFDHVGHVCLSSCSLLISILVGWGCTWSWLRFF
jgi:rhomboid-like protein